MNVNNEYIFTHCQYQSKSLIQENLVKVLNQHTGMIYIYDTMAPSSV